MPNKQYEALEVNLGDVGEIFCKQDIEGVEVDCYLEVHSDGFTHDELENFYTFCRNSQEYLLDAFVQLDRQHDALLGPVYEALFAIEPDLMEEQFPGAGHFSDITPVMTRKRISPKSVTMKKNGSENNAIVVLGSNSKELGISLSARYDLDGKLLDLQLDH